MTETKKCTRCKQSKELNQFPKAMDMVSGRSSWCRECVRNNQKKLTDERRRMREFGIV